VQTTDHATNRTSDQTTNQTTNQATNQTTFEGPPVEDEPGMGPLTLGALLSCVAERHGPREALCFHERDGTALRWTYSELETQARLVARGLVAAGASKGTRVALLMGNRPDWVAAAFGVALAGGVLVPVNTLFELPEIEHVLKHSGAALLLYQARLGRHDYRGALARLEGSLPYLNQHFCLGTPELQEFLEAGDDVDAKTLEGRARGVSPHDDAIVIYTSGTTERPKGVLHSHRAPAIQSWRFACQLCLDPTVRVWSAFPFFWSAGFCMVMGATLAAGGCLVLQEIFEPGEALELIESERVTSPHAWTHQLAALEAHPDWATRDLSSVRHVESFSSFGRHPSVRVDGAWSPRAAYGLTETFTIVSSLPANTPDHEREGHEGQILPGNSVRIVDGTGAAQGTGVLGEIRVKGPTLMKEYLGVAKEETFDVDGFFATGDAGFVDDQNRLHWAGRTNGLIKTGGANVSPVEIENELLRHPDLSRALAVGVPDAVLGEVVVVCAVAQPGRPIDEEDLRQWLRGRIASYKVPRRVLFFDDEDLVETGNSKVRVDELRELAISRLAGEDRK